MKENVLKKNQINSVSHWSEVFVLFFFGGESFVLFSLLYSHSNDYHDENIFIDMHETRQSSHRAWTVDVKVAHNVPFREREMESNNRLSPRKKYCSRRHGPSNKEYHRAIKMVCRHLYIKVSAGVVKLYLKTSPRE